MATVTTITTAEEDAAILRYIQRNPGRDGEVRTAETELARVVRHWLEARLQELREERTRELGDLHDRVTPEDRAVLDALREKYRR
jgi:hypothetical protein